MRRKCRHIISPTGTAGHPANPSGTGTVAPAARAANTNEAASNNNMTSGPNPNPSPGRRRSSGTGISAGEGVWLVRHHDERRRSSEEPGHGLRGRLRKRMSAAGSDTAPDPSSMGLAAATTAAAAVNGNTRRTPTAREQAPEHPDRVVVHSTKNVQFSTVTVRYHATVLGINPFCTSGPPISIGWRHDPSATDADVPIDEYERGRSSAQKKEWDLALSRAERERRLLDAGYSREEIAAGIREVNRIKAQRRQTVVNLNISGAEEFAESFARASKRCLLMRRSSIHLYNEWKARSRGIVIPVSPQVSSRNVVGSAEEQQQQQHFSAAGRLAPPPPPAPIASSPTSTSTSTMTSANILRSESADTRSSTPTKIEEVVSAPTTSRRQGYAMIKEVAPAFGITYSRLSLRVPLNEPPELKGDEEADKEVAKAEEEEIAIDDNEEEEAEDIPFATIEIVSSNSPAYDAGLHKGDKLIRFGGITNRNHSKLKAVAEVGQVASVKERSIPVVVEGQDGTKRELSIKPRSWHGRGHLGFLLKAYAEN